jgi:hypothetical protein
MSWTAVLGHAVDKLADEAKERIAHLRATHDDAAQR